MLFFINPVYPLQKSYFTKENGPPRNGGAFYFIVFLSFLNIRHPFLMCSCSKDLVLLRRNRTVSSKATGVGGHLASGEACIHVTED